ncbi:hypothetical protein CYY_004092 [Polysphondylium violaceum]|uniref:HAD-superfamily hydrolase n=1 Tax=Polysphondylium violaceum TaxID=133409 RepID=A0A8J4PWQ0_9MYCE|nr:hypothetical protein CYY_004092 [Polysphondylium violaceum]
MTQQQQEQQSFGIVFDIDGVLIRDGVPIPNATKALGLLVDQDTQQPKYPYIFVTNGGGFSEADKAKKVSKVLNHHIEEDHCMVAHTPMKTLVDKYRDNDVLLVSKSHKTSEHLAQVYGFKHFTSLQQYVEERPFLYPTKYSTFWTKGVASEYDIKKSKDDQLPFKAIILLEEPLDWGECIQIIVDIAQSKDGLLEKNFINKADTQMIDVHIANPDISYGGEFVLPRFTMGALTECIKTLYKIQTGRDLIHTFYGKPYKLTYEYAKELLSNQLKKLNHQSPPKHIYAIGDNPYSDIKGANNLKSEGWVSILVKTGCWKSEFNHPEIPADHYVNDVLEAVELILRLENKNSS